MKRRPARKQRTMAKNLERRFNAGADVLDYFDTKRAVRIYSDGEKAAFALRCALTPAEGQAALEEARRLGVPPDSLAASPRGSAKKQRTP